MFHNGQTSLGLSWEKLLPKKLMILKEIINDRKSKYTLVAGFIEKESDIKDFLMHIKKDPYFRDATHNSYAYRYKTESKVIVEWKNDDGETGAWMCILREIQRENGINMIVVVTRYFWWIKLQTDRYKNVIDACKIFFWQIK